METAHTTQITSQPPSIAFDDWKGQIQMATDLDQLVRVVRSYLHAWTPDDLNQLPCDLAAIALADSEDIVSRAVLASRIELKFEGTNRQHRLLREMSLTLAAAATRLRFLKAIRV